ncbi:MAG: hypothetical protein IKS23_05445 [Alphaproteobacteria bacterium]|nr:hypothetical protein [Alphaproteobacteria bacterium]
MPQLEPSSYISQIFWLTITFLSLWFVMSLFIIPRIKEIVDAREQKIEDYVQKASLINKQALQTLERYQKAVESAKAQAEEKISAQKQELSQILEAKKSEIDAAITEKMDESKRVLDEDREQTLNAIDEISQKTADIILQKLGF